MVDAAQQAKPEHKGLFSSKKEQPNPAMNFVSNQMSSISSRLRILEERFTNLRNRDQVTEQNMLSFHKKVNTEFKTLTSEINELRKEFNELSSQIGLIIKELQLSAKREDVKVLEKYIELWQPLQFVTKKDVEKIVKQIIEEQSKRFINV